MIVIFIIGILVLLSAIGVGIYGISTNTTGAKVCAPIAIILAIVLMILPCMSFVSTGYTGIVTTFGKVHDEILDAGLHFHSPCDNVVSMDNREQRVTFTLEAFSKDIQQVDVQGSINYNIDKSTAMNLYKDVGTNYANILITPRVLEDVKIKIAGYTAEKLVENRQKASDDIYELLREELAPKGINVISFAIENIDFTDAFESAVEAKQVATQKKQQAQTEQDKLTMETEKDAERKKIEAEAKAEVKRINADAAAYETKVKAEAEAEANRKLSQSLTTQLIDYNKILRWDGKLPTFMGGDSTPVIRFDGAE